MNVSRKAEVRLLTHDLALTLWLLSGLEMENRQLRKPPHILTSFTYGTPGGCLACLENIGKSTLICRPLALTVLLCDFTAADV